MIFNNHSNLEGQHAFLSASQYHWLNYDIDKLKSSFINHLATLKGTELHDLASRLIKKRMKLESNGSTISLFTNDAIDLGMSSEKVLYFSMNCFGTADAISCDDLLRIHDLKTGKTTASMNQLMIYAALFCLEYDVNPEDIQIELRIYQLDAIKVCQPMPREIRAIMDTIIIFDEVIEELKQEELRNV